MYPADNIGTSRVFGLKSMKSILLAVLMVSMSLSVGLIELNKAPWLVEGGENELGEADTPMQTSAPSITYSSSTLALSNNTAMTPLTRDQFRWCARDSDGDRLRFCQSISLYGS